MISDKQKMLNLRSFISCQIKVLLLFVISFTSSYAMDLSTPESTAMEYCRGAGDGVKEIFHPPVDPDSFGEGWSDCKIVEVKETTEIGKKYEDGRLVVRKGDVEVVFEVILTIRKSKKIKARYWQLLRKFDDKWKIIAWYRVPDKYFNPKT